MSLMDELREHYFFPFITQVVESKLVHAAFHQAKTQALPGDILKIRARFKFLDLSRIKRQALVPDPDGKFKGRVFTHHFKTGILIRQKSMVDNVGDGFFNCQKEKIDIPGRKGCGFCQLTNKTLNSRQISYVYR